MNTPAKLILGAIATGCIVVGVAAQVGTLPFPGSGGSAAGGAVEAQQATSPPGSTPQASPSPSPEPTQSPAPPPVVEAPPPPRKKKHGDG
ncbi:MAG TPA: hypothetical protein VFL27_06190 [Candidatus Dormibacteraeota bacterium]|nr:hypothetical protein [Candidatus Dormibacteraeota bacterium]